MMTKRDWCRIFTVTAVVFTTTLIWMAEPCIAGGGKYTYKKGFTSQKIDQEIKKRIQGRSYKKGAKISLDTLRYLQVRYIDFDGNVQEGEMIVNKKIARRTLKVFYQLYKLRYPIEKMKLVDEYGAEMRRRWQIIIHRHLITVKWQIPISCPSTARVLP